MDSDERIFRADVGRLLKLARVTRRALPSDLEFSADDTARLDRIKRGLRRLERWALQLANYWDEKNPESEWEQFSIDLAMIRNKRAALVVVLSKLDQLNAKQQEQLK
jgi:hypothetical protein